MEISSDNNFYRNITEWLASTGGMKFSKPIENYHKKYYILFEEFLHVCEEERWHMHAVSLLKFINEISLRAAFDRFLRSLQLNKPFFIISDSACTEANKVLHHL